MNSCIANLSRNKRRALLAAEARYRSNGDWGPWEEIITPNGVTLTGWGRQVSKVYRNKVFAVLYRNCESATHLAVSSLSGIRPTWHEMQRIKNDIAGRRATGIEVYPPAGEVVDEADMFHLWIVSSLPFTIWTLNDKS